MDFVKAFDMGLVINVLEIKPVFQCKQILWSKLLNEQLADSYEKGDDTLSLFILDSLGSFFTADWGIISKE